MITENETAAKQELTELLSAFEPFDERDIAEGLPYMEFKSFQKDEHLIKANLTCDWIAFIFSGIARNYYISQKGDEVTYCLTFPGMFISAYSSFIGETPTFENIHALTQIEALIIKKSDYEQLAVNHASWMRFSKFFAEQAYVHMEDRLLTIQMTSAENRYKELIANNPEYLHEVPLKYLASYLGITQRHLSRIRSNLNF